MLIFDYGGKEVSTDRYHWSLSITAPNRGVADQHFRTHTAAKGWAFTPETCFIRSRMLGRDGILYSDLEEKVDDGTRADG